MWPISGRESKPKVILSTCALPCTSVHTDYISMEHDMWTIGDKNAKLRQRIVALGASKISTDTFNETMIRYSQAHDVNEPSDHKNVVSERESVAAREI